MRLFKLIVALFTSITITNAANAAEVKMAKANWDTGYFQAEIYKQALEKMGYKVTEPKAIKPSVFYVAAAAGDLDLWVNGWFGTHDGYIKEAKGKVKKVGYVMKKGGLQGYLIDKKSADSLGIKSVMDIKKHAAKFDSNGDGKADMVACPPGWGCEKQITKHFAELGLGDFINPVKADYSASMADVVAKYKNGKPVLFYTWTPNWTVGALKLGQARASAMIALGEVKLKLVNMPQTMLRKYLQEKATRPKKRLKEWLRYSSQKYALASPMRQMLLR